MSGLELGTVGSCLELVHLGCHFWSGLNWGWGHLDQAIFDISDRSVMGQDTLGLPFKISWPCCVCQFGNVSGSFKSSFESSLDSSGVIKIMSKHTKTYMAELYNHAFGKYFNDISFDLKSSD